MGEHRQDDALQTKTNEVTDALRRTAANMRAELERSVMATQLLGQYFGGVLSHHDSSWYTLD